MPNAPVQLSVPKGTIIAPPASEYELTFPLSTVKIRRQGRNLILSFNATDQLVIQDFGVSRSSTPRWVAVEGHRCLYSRTVKGITSYQIQSMCKGKRFTDGLGAVSLEDAILIRDQLIANRKLGRGGQTVEAMRSSPPEAPARNWTLGDFRNERYLPHRNNLVRSSMDSQLMAGRWKNHIKAYFGMRKFEEVTGTECEEFVAAMRRKGTFGETTILHCLTDLRRLWAYARKVEATLMPFPGKDAIKEVARTFDNVKKCYLDPAEARLLLHTAWERRLHSRIDHDVYCYIVLGLALGLRAGEIHKLTRQAVERHIIDKTKNHRSRFVHFSFEPVRAMLEERFILYPPCGPDQPLFWNGKANLSTPRKTVPKKYYQLIKELGFNNTTRRKGHRLERIDFHALRHTFATLAAMRGVDHLTLMRLMGHRTPAMTLRYIEIADSQQARFQEMAMAGIFPEGGSELDSQKSSNGGRRNKKIFPAAKDKGRFCPAKCAGKPSELG